MDKAIKEKSIHKSREILERLESDPHFGEFVETLLTEITKDDTIDLYKNHTFKFSKQLLEPHINNLTIGIIDGFTCASMRSYLLYHMGLRRLFEVEIRAINNDSIQSRIKSFRMLRDRVET